MKTMRRLRWRIANLIDRIPGQCWSGLVDWIFGYRRLPWASIRSSCVSDAARCGACYCGKLRRPALDREATR